MNEAKHEATGRGQGWVAVVLMLLVILGLPLIYCLSLGPAIWIVNQAGVDATFFEVFYAPLEWLHEHVELARLVLDWYVGFWE